MHDKNEHMKPSLSISICKHVCCMWEKMTHLSMSNTFFFYFHNIWGRVHNNAILLRGTHLASSGPELGRCLNMVFSSTWRCLCLVCSLWLSFHLLWHLIYFEHLFHLIILELCDTSTYVRPEQLSSGDCYSNGPQVESKCVGQIRSVLWDRGCG